MAPLLMIPGPIELSPAVTAAAAAPPLGHLSPAFTEAFSRSLKALRQAFKAAPDAQPFIMAGSGTTAMEMAVANVVQPGDKVLVMWSGYFSDRLAEMITRYGAQAELVYPEGQRMIGKAPRVQDIELAGHTILCATHVDTSTGVRVDAEAIATFARKHGLLSIIDGVCAAGGEAFEMEQCGADVYLTASQKALGAPPGLALLVASQRALEKRKQRATPPPMSVDWEQWLPIMQGYETLTPKYFATPATSLVMALDVALQELAGPQAQAAETMRAAWRELGLKSLVQDERDMANTLSALYYPPGVDASFVKRCAQNGVVVAGGLITPIAAQYFRVGHMGYSARTPEHLQRTVRAISQSL